MENKVLNSNLKMNTPKIVERMYIRIIYGVLMAANFLCMLLGALYLLASGSGALWNIYGVLMIITLLCTICMTAVKGKRRALDYLYLLLCIFGMMIVLLLNTFSSSAVNDKWSRNIVSITLLLLLFLIGGIISGLRFFNYHKKDAQEIGNSSIRDSKFKRTIRVIAVTVLSINLLTGIYMCCDLVSRNKGGLLEVFVPEFSLFFGFIFLASSILIYRLIRTNRRSKFKPIVILVGLIIFIVCSLPLLSVPYLLNESKKNYNAAFGTGWDNNLDNASKEYFMSTPFSIPDYFLGIPSGEYCVKENVLFYEGKDGVDKGVKLYFDVYTPPDDKGNLPGGNSILIRIHGGGWTIGDKGAENSAQVNKYFASRGYVVFDIQYGLHKGKKFVEFADVPENVLGDFNIDDMVRQIGIFTKYLAEHGDEYDANLDSVFISGGSAGGQLTIASGLALSSGKYNDIFDSRLKIKGMIPFYPANGLAETLNISGTNELADPSALVDKNSPPCLIYQGTHDGLVDPQIPIEFRDAYLEKGNSKCALLLMPYSGHAGDMYYPGYYNQVFMYYMERFMYQYR